MFWAWELKGLYPAIFENAKYGAQAKDLFEEAQKLLLKISGERIWKPRGVFGFWQAHSVGEDVELVGRSEKFHFLRQQQLKGEGDSYLSLSDFIAPKEMAKKDYLGAFAVTAGHGVDEIAKKLRAEMEDGKAILVQACADRLAEAFAEMLHERVRREWGIAESLTTDELIEEKYQGIRPAAGYPSCPDHTEKATLWKLLEAEHRTGITLTESFAMWPAASVSGLYFAHPEARYFAVDHITRDQVEDYARRKGWPVSTAERWLAPNLGYDP